MGNLLDRAKKDAIRIITNGGFETEITLTKGLVSVETKGLAPSTHLTFDSDGLAVNTSKRRVCVSETDLVDKGLTVRNAKNDVYLVGVLLSFADNSGVTKTYVVGENWADNTLGVIVLILEKYAAS